ncbi:MAG: hypothetical protein IJZ03_04590 [Clostridia bacterium]|nr:hypothetical protein [Clostridia bacterium]MBQ9749454.1 hypothetical protein [Clostridia bacterium]
MKKIDQVVLKETLYVSAWVLIFSALTQAVFLLIGKWDYTVLFGNLLSASAAILNFFLMGISVQKAVTKEEKEAKNVLKISQLYRNILLLVVTVVGVVLKCFNTWSVIIPLFFPRIAIMLRPLFDKGRS